MFSSTPTARIDPRPSDRNYRLHSGLCLADTVRMAPLPRESSFMPAIKCSNCGIDVEISMMGEHICAVDKAAPAPARAPQPTSAPAQGGSGFSIGNLIPTSIQERLGGVADTFMPLGGSVHDKIGAIPPVDTAMASEFLNPTGQTGQVCDADESKSDRSYSRQPVTPISLSSGSKSLSPKTRPSIGRADDYFSRIDDAQSYAKPTRPGGYGGFGAPVVAPASPDLSPKSGRSLLNRIENIVAGPYAGQTSAPPPMPSFKSQSPFKPNEDRERSNPSPPRMPKNTGYGGFAPAGRDGEDFSSPHRAETFPVTSSDRLDPPNRAPSAPGPRPDRLRDTSRPPPPRTSLIRIKTKHPSINLDAEFGANNPYHSTSPSTASSFSRGSSHISQPSVNTSPARSASSRPFDVSPAETSISSQFENLLNDVKTSMDDMEPREKRLGMGTGERFDPAVQGGRPPSPPPSKWDREERHDPAVQGGRSPGRSRDLPPSPLDAPAPARRRDAVTQKSRGNCRACGEVITGKSISSADGRLSGRYHKACFNCTSCFEPFPTAEFYVHGDRPYCKRHYHKINGSLCGTCKDGIEGQYLEDERSTKYHVQCFRCGDCQRVLHDGYFEVNRQAYCEKDAYRRLQGMQRNPSISSQRSYGSSPLAPPGRPGMRPTLGAPRPGMQGRMGLPMQKGPGMGLAPPSMPKMEKRMTRLGMMGGGGF